MDIKTKNIIRMSVVIGFFLVLLSLIGCNDKQLNASIDADNTSSNSTLDNNRAIKFEEDGLVVDIPAHEEYVLNQKKYQVKPILLDLNKIKEVVFPEDSGKVTIDSTYKDGEELTTENGLMIYQENDGSLISASTEAYYIYNGILDFTEDVTLETATDGELDFMSKASVEGKVREIIKNLGISFESEEMNIKAYSNQHFWESIEFCKKNPDYADFTSQEDFERNWDLVDEVYYVQVKFKEGEIPIDSKGYLLLDESMIPGMQMEILLTKEGIQSLMFYTPLEKREEKNIVINSVADMLDAIKEKYNNIITDSKPSIIGMSMEYNILPETSNGELYLSPVIRFDTKEVIEMHSTESEEIKKRTVYDVIRVNAETGRIIE